MTEEKRQEIQYKINKIEQTKDYNSVKVDWLPPAHSDEYYFVSYSHKDYKKVFKDLFELQNFGEVPIHIWYDSALRVGKDWEIEARAHIYDYKCKGVIFYISENSVLSDSIHKEIEFVKKSGKSYLSINLPIETISNHKGKYYSAEEVLRLLNPNLRSNDSKLKVLRETFNKKITYLKLTDSNDANHKNNIKFNVKHICDDLVPLPLLIIKDNFVIGINDQNVISIKENDFITENGTCCNYISNCVFSNCMYLEKVEIPDCVTDIGEFAFYNCRNLYSITIPSGHISIGDSAFRGCHKLNKIIISGFIKSIGRNVFSYCNLKEATITSSSLYAIPKDKLKRLNITREYITNAFRIYDEACLNSPYLENVVISNGITEIGKAAFLSCNNLKNVVLPNGLKLIEENAFMGCYQLKDIYLPHSLIKIGKYAFHGCENLLSIYLRTGIEVIEDGVFAHCRRLKEINIPEGITEIKAQTFKFCSSLKCIKICSTINKIYTSAFFGCVSLTEIHFNGTIKQWNEIEKEPDWDMGTLDYTVFCIDGKIKKL